MASGTATLDFGSHPGSGHAKVVVSGQTNLLTTSRVEAWLEPADTADHKHDEHIVAPILVRAGNKVAGTSFTIHGYVLDPGGQSEDHKGGSGYTRTGRTARRMWGRWNVAWASDYT
jgi:hypothetical protein